MDKKGQHNLVWRKKENIIEKTVNSHKEIHI